MHANNTIQPKTCCVSARLIAVDRPERIDAIAHYTRSAAALLFALCAGHTAELPLPGDAIDTGDSYGLRDGSRVVLHRVVNEVAFCFRGFSAMAAAAAEPLVSSFIADGSRTLATIEICS